MHRITYLVETEDGWRVDYLMKKKFFVGSGMISSLKRVDEGIMLNGRPVHTDVRVKQGDEISFLIDDVGGFNPAPPVDIPLTIVYEDDYLVVVDKPAGLATQGPPEIGDRTLAGVFSFRYGQDKSFHPVSRLDRGTSGLMAVAKCGYVHDRLRRQLHTDGYVRKYMALVEGIPRPPAAEIDLAIARESDRSLKRIISEEGKPSKTFYKTLEKNDKYALLEVTPFTGRTHQIRVHLAAIGYPLVGDWLYGAENAELISRPALHSFFLSFRHPVFDKTFDFSSSLPEDIRVLL
ncbi:MAG: RluA family pseudouridine synthase [Clostridia bacterium]|nr:RluA family pseudouridine synthase [Clostridia bacterium]